MQQLYLFMYVLIILLLIGDLTLFYTRHHKTRLLNTPPVTSADMVYPIRRTFYPLASCPLATPSIPPDLSPLVFKRASLTHPDDNFIFFRHERFNDMLKLFAPQGSYEQALGVNSPIVYFTPHVKIFPENISKKEFIKAVYKENTKGETRTVFFSEKDIDFYSTNNNEVLGKGLIEYTKTDDPNNIEILVEASRDGFLVRLENFHPSWQAFIDGKKAHIYRANYAFQAIRVPKGRHEIRFRFSTIYPLLLYIHIFCVFLNWVAFSFYLFIMRKRVVKL